MVMGSFPFYNVLLALPSGYTKQFLLFSHGCAAAITQAGEFLDFKTVSEQLWA